MSADNEPPEAPPRDRPFDPYRLPLSEAAKDVVADIINQLQNYEVHLKLRKRKRRVADQGIFEATVSALVCDAIYHHLSTSQGGLAIPRSNRVLGSKNRYRSEVYGKTLPTILDRLASHEMEFLEMVIGNEGFDSAGRQTVIRAGSRLVTRTEDHGITLADIGKTNNGEVIRLRAAKRGRKDKGALMNYSDTSTTRRYREQIQAINSWLADADIIFDETYVDRDDIDEHDRHLRRIFTNGSFESGGRLYGGFWQQLKKGEREDGIVIDHETIRILDYGQMCPRILYGLAYETPPSDDAYLLPGFEDHRDGAKIIFNAMVSATKPLFRMPQGVRQEFSRKTTISDVTDAVIAAHPALVPFFHKGLVHKTQFIDSQIIIDVLLTLKERGIVALPIHDAVVVPVSRKDETKEIMETIFKSHTGVDGLVREEG